MAFSIRKMLSNITYFKKPGEDDSSPETSNDPCMETSRKSYEPGEVIDDINFEAIEPDSTSRPKPESTKSFASKKVSLSDTDLRVTTDMKKEKRKSKKLKLDIKKANKSMEEIDRSRENVENTPKHILMECQTDMFSLKKLDLIKTFDLFSEMSDDDMSSFEEGKIDVESLSDTDTDISLISDADSKPSIKMCRKVDESDRPGMSSSEEEPHLVPSATPESFGDVEIDKTEEERMSLLLNYQLKFEKMEGFLKKVLTDFQFHIDVSKVFNCRSFITTPQCTDISEIPKSLGEVTYMDNISRGVSPTGSWNIIMEKEDDVTKSKLKSQLLTIRQSIDEFLNNYLKTQTEKNARVTFNFNKKRIPHKRIRICNKKKVKHFDFPDYREAMLNLFCLDSDRDDSSVSGSNITSLLSDEESESLKCGCRCHSSLSQTDSGLTSKSNERSLSITSSIGNFSLDASTLTAYSESLDQIISYNSFQDTSLLSTLLQKAAIERITFYVQVHSIQLKCEQTDEEYESKNIITFHCPSCKTTENEENGLLRHILCQSHCEKIHFTYKTAYIKKCVQAGKEIQPSTVLNPMKMYRDDNKIVCFGDAIYACSLCFENLIIGESVLMAHCSEPEHVDRKERLCEILE